MKIEEKILDRNSSFMATYKYIESNFCNLLRKNLRNEQKSLKRFESCLNEIKNEIKTALNNFDELELVNAIWKLSLVLPMHRNYSIFKCLLKTLKKYHQEPSVSILCIFSLQFFINDPPYLPGILKCFRKLCRISIDFKIIILNFFSILSRGSIKNIVYSEFFVELFYDWQFPTNDLLLAYSIALECIVKSINYEETQVLVNLNVFTKILVLIRSNNEKILEHALKTLYFLAKIYKNRDNFHEFLQEIEKFSMKEYLKSFENTVNTFCYHIQDI